MKFWLLDTLIYSLSLIVVVVFGLIPSYYGLACDIAWFPRSGALLVIIGTFLTYTEFVGLREKWLKKLSSKKTFLAFRAARESATPNRIDLIGTDVHWERSEIKKRILRSGVFTIIIGTFVWGYGDVLFKILR